MSDGLNGTLRIEASRMMLPIEASRQISPGYKLRLLSGSQMGRNAVKQDGAMDWFSCVRAILGLVGSETTE